MPYRGALEEIWLFLSRAPVTATVPRQFVTRRNGEQLRVEGKDGSDAKIHFEALKRVLDAADPGYVE